jgi:hypothetical protein
VVLLEFATILALEKIILDVAIYYNHRFYFFEPFLITIFLGFASAIIGVLPKAFSTWDPPI